MLSILTNLRTHILSNTTLCVLLGVTLLELLYILSPNTVSAASLQEYLDVWQWIHFMMAVILTSIFGLMGALLYLAAIFLNYAISFGVLQMGEHVSGNPGINIAWILLRDIANIIFIFGMVFIGINTIVGNTTYGYKQFLAKIIIAALLVNFSMFFTKALVDISNRFATEIYGFIIPDEKNACANTTFFINEETLKKCLGVGITGTTMNHFGLMTFLNDSKYLSAELWTNQSISKDAYDRISLISFFGSIFVLITSFIFLAGAILLLVRFAILILLMVVSPLALALWAVPKGSGYFYLWLRTLLNQSFFAPLFLLLVWISLLLMQGFTTNTNNVFAKGSFAGALLAGKDLSPTSIFIQFGLMSIFMISALIASKELGAWGASRAINIGKNISKYPSNKIGSFLRRHPGTVAAAATGAFFAPAPLLLGGIAGAVGWKAGKSAAAAGYRKVVSERATKLNEKWQEKVKAGSLADSLRQKTAQRIADSKIFSGETYTERKNRLINQGSNVLKQLIQKGDEKGIADYLARQELPVGNALFASLSPQYKLAVQQKLNETQYTSLGTPDARETDRRQKRALEMLRNLRDDQRDKYVEFVTKQMTSDITQLYEDLQKLEPTDRESAYKKLSAQNRVAFDEVRKTRESLSDNQIEDYRKRVLSLEEFEKTQKEFNEFNKRVQKRNRALELENLVSLPGFATPGSPSRARIEELMREMKDEDVIDLDINVLEKIPFAITVGMLTQLAKAGSVSDATRTRIKNSILGLNRDNHKQKKWLKDKNNPLAKNF